MRDEEKRLAPLPKVRHSLVALGPVALVPDRQHFVHEENVRVDLGGDGEGQPRRHAGRVRPDRGVEERFQLGEGRDRGGPVEHLLPRAAEERAVQDDVLPPRQLRVEPQAQGEQRRHVAPDDDTPAVRAHDAGDGPEERALPAPFGPMIPTRSPGWIVSETSLSATSSFPSTRPWSLRIAYSLNEKMTSVGT